MDSNGTKNQLKNLIGFVGFGLLKRQLQNVKLKIDAEKKLVTITKNGRTFVIGFDEIERLTADF
ncbi:hypothetical protein ES703_47092 [subsurface metagenome]